MPKLTIDALNEIREKAQKTMTLREGGENKARVTVHMGTCGIAAGAREVMNSLLEEIEKNNIKDVLVRNTACAGYCKKEPMITVELAGKTPVKYIEVSPDKMKKIFKEHVLEGRIVEEYMLAQGSESTDTDKGKNIKGDK